MAIVRASLDEPRERQLVEDGWAALWRLLGSERLRPARRRHGPAEPEPGPERLAQRSEQGCVIGIGALHGPDGAPVVPELGVVVIFKDQPIRRLCPLNESCAACWCEHGPGWELMCGRRDGSPDADCGQLVGAHAFAIDGDRRDLQAGPLDTLAQPTPAWVLNGNSVVAGAHERPTDPGHAVQDAGGDRHVLRFDNSSANALQIVG